MVYALYYTIEETLEMLGIAYFIVSLMRYIISECPSTSLHITFNKNLPPIERNPPPAAFSLTRPDGSGKGIPEKPLKPRLRAKKNLRGGVGKEPPGLFSFYKAGKR